MYVAVLIILQFNVEGLHCTILTVLIILLHISIIIGSSFYILLVSTRRHTVGKGKSRQDDRKFHKKGAASRDCGSVMSCGCEVHNQINLEYNQGLVWGSPKQGRDSCQLSKVLLTTWS